MRHTMANTLDKLRASSKSIELLSSHTDADITREQYMNAEFEQTRRDMQKVSEFNKNILYYSQLNNIYIQSRRVVLEIVTGVRLLMVSQSRSTTFFSV